MNSRIALIYIYFSPYKLKGKIFNRKLCASNKVTNSASKQKVFLKILNPSKKVHFCVG